MDRNSKMQDPNGWKWWDDIGESSVFFSLFRWLPKAEYEAKKREEQAQMRLGHSEYSEVKLEKMMLQLLVHFQFNLYLGNLVSETNPILWISLDVYLKTCEVTIWGKVRGAQGCSLISLPWPIPLN